MMLSDLQWSLLTYNERPMMRMALFISLSAKTTGKLFYDYFNLTDLLYSSIRLAFLN